MTHGYILLNKDSKYANLQFEVGKTYETGSKCLLPFCKESMYLESLATSDLNTSRIYEVAVYGNIKQGNAEGVLKTNALAILHEIVGQYKQDMLNYIKQYEALKEKCSILNELIICTYEE